MKVFKSILFINFTFRLLFSQELITNKIKYYENKIKSFNDSIHETYKIIEKLKFEYINDIIKKYGMPRIEEDGFLVYHSAFALFYIDKYSQSRWVVHVILPDISRGVEKRTNDFRIDTLIPTGTPDRIDYIKSGYDRGHLAPSADFRWSKKALSESYYYSNIAPQRPEFNRGKWAELEDFLRNYVINTSHPLIVVTGGLLHDTIKKFIGVNRKIPVPPYFYKAILDIESQPPRGIAFYMLNGINTKPITSYAISIDSLEKITKIDFFYNLPDSMEERIESMKDISHWLTTPFKGNVAPLEVEELPKNAINTIEAEKYINSKATVCGTVVATRVLKDAKGVILNLDQNFPNNLFTVTIWQNNIPNFSFEPAIFLKDKKICVTGLITKYKGTPTMEIRNEKQIEFLDENN
ncbi:MAG: DNA/RNA non-specific endonuclease [Bacteroidales bacterium]|nr:DNA/RNA non-specific endonuclease [Bacteroidales bacterium]